MTDGNKDPFLCKKHMSNDGFMDPDVDIWRCWICYREDPINNPTGKVIDEFRSGKNRFLLRVLYHADNCSIESCDLRTRKIDVVYRSRDLSATIREFVTIKKMKVR